METRKKMKMKEHQSHVWNNGMDANGMHVPALNCNFHLRQNYKMRDALTYVLCKPLKWITSMYIYTPNKISVCIYIPIKP